MIEATTNQAITNRGWRLRRNPAGALAAGDLELITDPIAPLRDGQALVRTLVLSVEAASRIWLGHQRAFMPSVPVGEVMRGIGVGEVIASRRADLRPGDVVAGFLGWQEFYTEPYLAWHSGTLWATDSFNHRVNAYDARGMRPQAVNEYNKAIQTGSNYDNAQAAAKKFLATPYNPRETTAQSSLNRVTKNLSQAVTIGNR